MRTPLQDWIAQEHGRRHYFHRDAVMAHLSLSAEAFEQERHWLLQHQWIAEDYPGLLYHRRALGQHQSIRSRDARGPILARRPDALFTNPIPVIAVVVRVPPWRHPPGDAAH